MSTDIHITGWGAVSPAGWTAQELWQAVRSGTPLPCEEVQREGGGPLCRLRKTPSPAPLPDWMKQPRMRRTTAAARHAVGAAVEALGPDRLAATRQGAWRVGVIFCTMNGCVQFSRRFFAEALQNPALASPILFPETVHNAPASHIGALLGSPEMNNTLVGDSAQFLRGLEMGAMWLEDACVDAALVVAAEELDWVTYEAVPLFHRGGAITEGAAAVLLERTGTATDSGRSTVHVRGLTQAWTYGQGMSQKQAATAMRRELGVLMREEPGTLLCDGLGAGPRVDQAEQLAWASWEDARLSVRPVLGEGFGITAGWQVVAACEALAEGGCPQAVVSAVGLAEQAVGLALGPGLRAAV